MHRGPEQSGGVLRLARDGDVDPGIMGEGSFVRLAVPETAAGQVGAIGRVDHERAGPGAKGAPAQVAEIRHELVPGRADEVDELQFEDRPLAVGGQAAGDAQDGRFRERRIENLLREFGRKFLGETKDAALRIFDVLAENDAAASLSSGRARSVWLTTSPIRYLPGGQHFVVELREFARDFAVPVRRPTDPGRVPPR